MKKHSSFPRNHNIANVFYKAGFVDTCGRGFKKIKEEFERVHLPLPVIEENCGGVMAVMTDIPQRTIEREISALQKMKVLSREGSPRTGKWVIKEKGVLN